MKTRFSIDLGKLEDFNPETLVAILEVFKKHGVEYEAELCVSDPEAEARQEEERRRAEEAERRFWFLVYGCATS